MSPLNLRLYYITGVEIFEVETMNKCNDKFTSTKKE